MVQYLLQRIGFLRFPVMLDHLKIDILNFLILPIHNSVDVIGIGDSISVNLHSAPETNIRSLTAFAAVKGIIEAAGFQAFVVCRVHRRPDR